MKDSIKGALPAIGSAAAAKAKRPTWGQAEGVPLPLGVTWIQEEQAFNFAVHAESAESVTLLLYAATDLVNPLLVYRFDFLRNKSGRIWHCRIPIAGIGACRYYAYSVSGENVSGVHSFDPQKVLLDPYAKAVFFPPGFDRELAMREGSNAGRAPLGVLNAHRPEFPWTGERVPHHESDAIIYELHVKGFTKKSELGCGFGSSRHVCRFS
jgi:isoamylase